MRNTVAPLQPIDMVLVLVFEVVVLGVVVVNPRSVIPKNTNTATERGSKTPAKKLYPKYPVI